MAKKFALKEVLKERCVNVSALARKAGVDRATLERAIKTGRCSLQTLEKVAQALGMDITEFWREENTDG